MTKENLPDEYVPIGIRDLKRKTMYGIGTEYTPGEFGMIDGPNSNIYELLDKVCGNGDCIIRFNEDGTDDVLFRWVEDRWKLSKKKINEE